MTVLGSPTLTLGTSRSAFSHMLSQTTIYHSQKARQEKVNIYICLGPSSDAPAALQIPGSAETKFLSEAGFFS